MRLQWLEPRGEDERRVLFHDDDDCSLLPEGKDPEDFCGIRADEFQWHGIKTLMVRCPCNQRLYFGYAPVKDAAEAFGKLIGRWIYNEDDVFKIRERRCGRFSGFDIHSVTPVIRTYSGKYYYVLRDFAKCFPKIHCFVCGKRILYAESKNKVYLESDTISEFSSLVFQCSEKCFLAIGKENRRRCKCRAKLREALKWSKVQVKALRKYLKTGDPEVLTSLPRGYGPA